jgi:riboflavin synthase
MFTGLIEAVGTVAELKPSAGGFRIRIRSTLASALTPGDSLAVNGVCLTVVTAEHGEVHADIGPETARVTTLGSLRPDQSVNLERPMAADGRVGGHFVQGHVDGTGVVDEIRPDGDSHWLTVSFDRSLAPYFIRKGSVAIDGVSLTVAGLGASMFDVMIIPFTWANTALASLKVHDRVNLECDMIGKYVARAVALAGEQSGAGTDLKIEGPTSSRGRP